MSDALHLTNSKGRDATVGLSRVARAAPPRMGLPGTALSFRRYVAASETCTHAALQARMGADYGAALVEGDPEIDTEKIGMFIERTQRVFIDGEGDLLRVEPRVMELLLDPDGNEKERRDPVDSDANVNAPTPLRWTGRKIPVAEAVRRFAFKRRLLLQHVDGLTFDFLFEMARDLEASQALMLLGSGEKGAGPLVFQANGRPYRGFLHGRTDGRRYRLMLLLSEMELKAPVAGRKESTHASV